YRENRITLVYDSMWGGTRKLAEAVAQGIHQADPEVDIRLYNTAQRDKNDVITSIFCSKALLFGSPTINKGILTSIAALIEEVKGLRFRDKKAAAFGCYGWSGESVATISEELKSCGFELVDEGLKTLWEPGDEIIDQARDYGRRFAEAVRE
ncbi:MAG TPA: anaerobic nitric oxide reductase flavorubredoxin, partial [Sediminispirochaeta sp.]|nr:anaerobic nitric oxide reductase flavorubredoxin [Sediminispirochaeta sp.]